MYIDINFYNKETQVLSAFEPFLTIFKFLKTFFGYRGTLPRLLAGHVKGRGGFTQIPILPGVLHHCTGVELHVEVHGN